jgi:deoxyribonuclease-4
MGRPKETVYKIVKENFKQVLKTLKNEGIADVWLRPETTGKETQWGDLDECIKLSQELDNVLPCIDFAHLHARYNGTNNTREEFRQIMKKIEKGLGKNGLNNMHIQISGINYGPKGEKNHLNLKQSDLKYKELLKVLKEFKIKGVIVDESPNVEGDALLLQKTFRSL